MALHDAFDARGLPFDECDTPKVRLLERVAVRLAGETPRRPRGRWVAGVAATQRAALHDICFASRRS
jgi:hypothetical protein